MPAPSHRRQYIWMCAGIALLGLAGIAVFWDFVLECGTGTSCSTARFYYKSDTLSASVIDAKTGEPVSGAVVVAFWKLQKGRFFHGHDYWVLQRIETVTDQRGRFSLEPWGPRFVRPAWRMSRDSPYVYVLKTGYKFEIASNNYTNSLVDVQWNSRQIKLQEPAESPDNYAISLSSIRSSLCDPYRNEGAECGSALVEYFAAEKRRLFAVGVKHAYW